ncbi:MAG TPA: SlyX family protein [Polyangiaceae bacterium]|nr:SlyX family protein [Polyangiaceae bacterium]
MCEADEHPDPERLLRLEEKVAYQDKLIAELNDVVVSLHRRADELEKRLAAAERTIRSELGGREMPNEKPPHY